VGLKIVEAIRERRAKDVKRRRHLERRGKE